MKKNKYKFGKCRLCLQDKDLCNSHIIPKFVFKKIKKGGTDFIVVQSGKDAYKSQREYREHLLCLKCEKIIHKFETYASSSLYNFKKFSQINNDKVTVKNIDYEKFKLFQLSILWRGHITSIEAFKDVKLDSENSEILRNMILNKDPGDEHEFGCTLFGITLQNKLQPQLMLNPGNFSVGPNKVIYYTFGGFRWHFIITRSRENIPIRFWSIDKNNQLIFKLRDLFDFPDFRTFFSSNFPSNLRA